jgi:hypothetical protein
MANGQTVAGGPADVVVVAADADRLGEYDDAFRKARIATRATLDADEAEGLVGSSSPNVLVLDRGLPRLTLFRLYGLVREDPAETRVQVVFVGQEDDTGPGDHYLPGDPSPTNVAERVTQLLADVDGQPVTARADEAARTGAAAAPREAPAEPASQDGEPATDGAGTPARAPATNGVTAASVAAGAATAEAATAEEASAEDAAADAPPRSGRRLDVILIRVGLVLLILGALLILIQSDAYPPSLVAPGAAPATPTQRPTASPKPGAFLDGAGVLVSVVDGRR